MEQEVINPRKRKLAFGNMASTKSVHMNDTDIRTMKGITIK